MEETSAESASDEEGIGKRISHISFQYGINLFKASLLIAMDARAKKRLCCRLAFGLPFCFQDHKSLQSLWFTHTKKSFIQITKLFRT